MIIPHNGYGSLKIRILRIDEYKPVYNNRLRSSNGANTVDMVLEYCILNCKRSGIGGKLFTAVCTNCIVDKNRRSHGVLAWGKKRVESSSLKTIPF